MTDERGVTELADDAADAWHRVAAALMYGHPDHSVLYSVIGSLDAALGDLVSLAGALRRHVASYPETRGVGREVYDDAGEDPRRRLLLADLALQSLGEALEAAHGHTAVAWSAVGHIGVREITPREAPQPPQA